MSAGRALAPGDSLSAASPPPERAALQAAVMVMLPPPSAHAGPRVGTASGGSPSTASPAPSRPAFRGSRHEDALSANPLLPTPCPCFQTLIPGSLSSLVVVLNAVSVPSMSPPSCCQVDLRKVKLRHPSRAPLMTLSPGRKTRHIDVACGAPAPSARPEGLPATPLLS